MRQISAFVLTAALFAPSALAAQQTPPPGCDAAEHRQFDFWVGSWTVTDSAGATTYGTSSVTAEEKGCLVHEHWAGSRGGTGQSFNYYDPPRKVWEQDWVGSGGGNIRLIGHLDGGAMVLEGDTQQGSAVLHQKVMWIPLPDGRVRQYWRQTADSGRTWTTVFDGYYRKVG